MFLQHLAHSCPQCPLVWLCLKCHSCPQLTHGSGTAALVGKPRTWQDLPEKPRVRGKGFGLRETFLLQSSNPAATQMQVEMMSLCRPILWLGYLTEQGWMQAEPSLKEAVGGTRLVSSFQMTLHFCCFCISTLPAALRLAALDWAANTRPIWPGGAQWDPEAWDFDGLSAVC